MSEVAKSLKKMSKLWSKTEARQASGFARLPDGEYTVDLVEMKVGDSKKGRLQVATKFRVAKPKDKKGKETMTFHGLENENNIAYFKGFAEVLGLELPDDIEDLEAAINSFVEDFEDSVTVKLTTKGDFQNLTIIAVGDNEVASGDDKSDDEDEDEDDEKKEEDDEDEDSDEDEEKEEDEDEDADEDEDDEDEDEDEDGGKKRRKKVKKEKKKKKKSRR